ncbi:MAG: hypothetical protein DWQ20_07050 [Actinobacteria bacterium]|nr:MAG: hypothetical protein DWQ20_07050 [Actinomycetota bacterium]
MPTTADISEARQHGARQHQAWKKQIAINNATGAGNWQVLWDDDTVEHSDPLVENIYSGSLQDKVYSAASALPQMRTFPARGTRQDRGERSAEKRRRIFESYWTRSRLEKTIQTLYFDWFNAGAAYTVPWANWIHATEPRLTSPGERFPFFMRMHPMFAYPLSHDSLGSLTEILVARKRPLGAMKKEYGLNHPNIKAIESQLPLKGKEADRELVEELWFFDKTHWAVAIGTSVDHITFDQRNRFMQIQPQVGGEGQVIGWLPDPVKDQLGVCPVVETKRATHDGEYRGALEDVIPTLRVAQNIMARLLDDIDMSIYAPTVLENIKDPHKYGPGAVLEGTGEGTARIERDRPPVNFEAQQTVAAMQDTARRQAAWPPQRSGNPDASIVSAKGVVALAGTFNVELATAQGDIAFGLQEITARTAALDEIHCTPEVGQKRIDGVEGDKQWSENYNPGTDINGDYRLIVSYGENAGLDRQNQLVQDATELGQGTMSRRQFIERRGRDALATERDILIEQLTDIYIQQVLPLQLTQQDPAVLEFLDAIDSDDTTTRGAVLKALRDAQVVAERQAAQQAEAGGAPFDALGAIQSLQSGGIPGVSPGLQNALPANISRLNAEVAPGGTAT